VVSLQSCRISLLGSVHSKEAHPAPIEEARVAPEMHATPTPPLHQVQEESEEVEDAPGDAPAANSQPQQEENLSRRSRPISHLSENNERWNDVVNEFKREIRPPNEQDSENDVLKEEIHEDVDEKTPLQVNC